MKWLRREVGGGSARTRTHALFKTTWLNYGSIFSNIFLLITLPRHSQRLCVRVERKKSWYVDIMWLRHCYVSNGERKEKKTCPSHSFYIIVAEKKYSFHDWYKLYFPDRAHIHSFPFFSFLCCCWHVKTITVLTNSMWSHWILFGLHEYRSSTAEVNFWSRPRQTKSGSFLLRSL